MAFLQACQVMLGGIETSPGTEQTTLAAMEVDQASPPQIQVSAPEPH